jgi:hypothetical protein
LKESWPGRASELERRKKKKGKRKTPTVEEVPTVRVQQGPTVRTGTVGAKNTLR